jgi:hypothetical protein
VQVPTTRREVAEVLPALPVQGHHLAVQDRLLDRQLLTDPVAKLLEPLEDVPPLGPEVTFTLCGTDDLKPIGFGVSWGIEVS